MDSFVAKLGTRSLFPNLTAKAYLDHAAVSPLSIAVSRAISDVTAGFERNGIETALSVFLDLVARLRGKAATFLGVSEETVGFVSNTTAGVNTVALSVPWQPGDRVILFEGEFPANVSPWQQAAKLFDLDLTFVPLAAFYRSVEEGLAVVDEALVKGARLMAVSLVQFQTGFRMPIAELGKRIHAAGGELFVDAIQGLGVVPFLPDECGVDFMSCGAHKWLMGLQGCGLFYARKSSMERLEPRTFGWTSHESAFEFLLEGKGHLRYDRPYRKDASAVEGGSPSPLSLAALEVSLDILADLGVDAVFRHLQRYHDALEPRLQALGLASLRDDAVEHRSGSLVFELPEVVHGPTLVAEIKKRGVIASLPDGHLRFSPHFPNPVDEVELVQEVVAESLAAMDSLIPRSP